MICTETDPGFFKSGGWYQTLCYIVFYIFYAKHACSWSWRLICWQCGIVYWDALPSKPHKRPTRETGEFWPSLPDLPLVCNIVIVFFTWIREGCSAFKQDSGCSIAKGPIHHIGMSIDPSQDSHTSKHISFLVAKHILCRGPCENGHACMPAKELDIPCEWLQHSAGTQLGCAWLQLVFHLSQMCIWWTAHPHCPLALAHIQWTLCPLPLHEKKVNNKRLIHNRNTQSLLSHHL